MGPDRGEAASPETQEPNTRGLSRGEGRPRVGRATLATGFGIGFLVGWGLILMVFRSAPGFGGFDPNLVCLSAVLPFWMGLDPIWKWINGGSFIVDGVPMIMLCASVAMVFAVSYTVWTGRRIGVAGAIMALYWFCSLMVVGLAY